MSNEVPAGEATENQSSPSEKRPTVDVARLSKKWLVDEITGDLDRYRRLIALTPYDTERAQQCPIEVLEFDNSDITSDEVKAILMKLIPLHLLQDIQAIKTVHFKRKAITPVLDEQGQLSHTEITNEQAEDNFLRILGHTREDMTIIYSPVGMSTDRDVRRVIIMQTIIHELGHGIFGHYLNLARTASDASQRDAALATLNYILSVARKGRSITEKSGAYDIDLRNPLSFFVEEFSEIVREFVFNRKRFQDTNFGTDDEPSNEKYQLAEKLFTPPLPAATHEL